MKNVGFMIQLRDGSLAGYGDDGGMILSTQTSTLDDFLSRETGGPNAEMWSGARVVPVEIVVIGAGMAVSGAGANAMTDAELREWDEMLIAGGHKERQVQNQGGAPTPTTTLVDTGTGEATTVSSTGTAGLTQTGTTESHIASAFAEKPGTGGPVGSSAPTPTPTPVLAPESEPLVPSSPANDSDSIPPVPVTEGGSEPK